MIISLVYKLLNGDSMNFRDHVVINEMRWCLCILKLEGVFWIITHIVLLDLCKQHFCMC